jgi:hypothetical protein
MLRFPFKIGFGQPTNYKSVDGQIVGFALFASKPRKLPTTY